MKLMPPHQFSTMQILHQTCFRIWQMLEKPIPCSTHHDYTVQQQNSHKKTFC